MPQGQCYIWMGETTSSLVEGWEDFREVAFQMGLKNSWVYGFF